MNDKKKLLFYINKCSENIKHFCLDRIKKYDRGCPKYSSHPDKQKEIGGLCLHTVQVIEKALELNQTFNEIEIIECCLIHDLKDWNIADLNEKQKNAILTTKGLPYEKWRKTKDYRFVVLILIADMWSAFINEKNYEK